MQTPTQISPASFPRGFAETDDHDFTPVLLKLEGEQLFDVGIRDYGEFFAPLEFGWRLLQDQQVPFDSRPGRVSVAARYANAVQLKWRPLDR